MGMRDIHLFIILIIMIYYIRATLLNHLSLLCERWKSLKIKPLLIAARKCAAVHVQLRGNEQCGRGGGGEEEETETLPRRSTV